MSENMISKIKIGNIEYELGTTIENIDGLQNVLDEKVTETELNAKGYLTDHQSLEGYATESYVNTKISEIEFDECVTKEELKDAIDEYFEENPVSSSNNSIFASDDDNGNVTITVVGFSVSDDNAGNITIS